MKVYSPAEVADLLGIKQPTLRKYSIMLEERGYNISRNSQNHRYYTDKDIITLRRIITGKNSGVTLEESINNVVSIDKHSTYPNAINNVDSSNRSDIQDDIQELKEIVLKQNELIKVLTDKMDQQQEYIKNSLNERDKILMRTMNELLENRKQIAAAQEEEKEKKKGFWSRLFKKMA